MYVILGEEGEICLNGAAVRHVVTGDVVIIASYAEYDKADEINHGPHLVFVDKGNKVTEVRYYLDSFVNRIS